MTEERGLQPFEPVRPLVTPEQAAKRWREFEELKTRLLTPWGKPNSDWQRIRVRERQLDGSYRRVEKDFIKRSGARKLAVYFGLSDRIVEQERVDRDDGSFTWRIIVEVEAPNGRVCTGVGVCDSRERKFAHVEHDVYATAHTRAKNRAILDMVAGGATSAEEVEAEIFSDEEPRKFVKAEQALKQERQKTTAGLRPGALSLDVIEYNLKAAGVDPEAVDVIESAHDFTVELRGEIDDEEWYRINETMKALGGAWEQRGLLSRWVIRKGAG